MKFESIKSKKFQTLAKSEMNKVYGGACSGSPGGTTDSGFKYSADFSDGNGSSTYFSNPATDEAQKKAALADCSK